MKSQMRKSINDNNKKRWRVFCFGAKDRDKEVKYEYMKKKKELRSEDRSHIAISKRPRGICPVS